MRGSDRKGGEGYLRKGVRGGEGGYYLEERWEDGTYSAPSR